jgi:hypothetical protein
MTSKYQFRIQIHREINMDMLQKLVQDLENGVILEFTEKPPPYIPWDALRLDIIASGYLDLKDNKKVIKFTNLQRREFISKAIKILKDPKAGEELPTLKISTNEYTASLFVPHFY